MFKYVRTIASYTLISRIFGYLRDFFIASYFGANTYTDMFFIAFKIPNTFRRIIGEGAMTSAVVPVLSKFEDKDKPRVMGNLVIHFIILLFVLTIIGVVFSKFLIVIFAPGFLSSVHLELLNTMIKVLFPYIFFIGLVVLLMGFMNTYNHFAIPAIAPTLFNISVIGSIYFLFSRLTQPIFAICIGAIIGGFLQLLISAYGMHVYRIPLKFTFKIENSTKEVFKLILLTALGGGVFQISTMIDAFLASFMKAGSFSYLIYADRLFQLPFAIFPIALAQASLPDLSKLTKNDIIKKMKLITQTVFIFSIATFLYFLFFGKDVIMVIFEHGKFNAIDVENTHVVLIIFMFGFLFFSLVKVLSNVFYALKDVKTPTKASTLSSIINIVCSVILGLLFGFKGLAASVAISGISNAVLLFVYINNRIAKFSWLNIISKRAISLCVILLVFSFFILRVDMIVLLRLVIATVFYIVITSILLVRHVKCKIT